MNFTREPIVETIITPKEGFKLVLRNSKGGGHEEFFVDAVEVISFGHASFYRSLEKPKCFLVPVGDYEILEMRETRVMLKTPMIEKGGIKIGGGREAFVKSPREPKAVEEASATEKTPSEGDTIVIPEHKEEKRREKRRLRKRRSRDQDLFTEEEGPEVVDAPFPSETGEEESRPHEPAKREERTSLIPPPPTLISETLARYKDAPGFSGAFFEKKEEALEKKIDEKSNKEEVHLLVEEEVEPDFFSEERITEEPEDEDEETI